MIALKWWRWYLLMIVGMLVGGILLYQDSGEEVAVQPETVAVMSQRVPAVQDDYTELRMERDHNRSMRQEMLQEAIAAETDADIRRERVAELRQSERNREAEREIELVMKARGYKDALAFCCNRGAEVMLRTEMISREEAGELGKIIASISSVAEEHIIIRTKP